MMAHHPIGGLVRAVRHLFGRQVRETGEDLVDLGAQSRRLGARLSRSLCCFPCLDLQVFRRSQQFRLRAKWPQFDVRADSGPSPVLSLLAPISLEIRLRRA